jgi:hypothetical protein
MYHIKDTKVIATAKQHNCTLFESIAILSADECDITPYEMPLYMAYFNDNMKNGLTYMDAIEQALKAIILNVELVNKILWN